MITSKDEYLRRLHDIQNKENLKELVTLPSDEPRFVIDANTREIFIPDEFTFLAVKNDHAAETIYFEIDRYFDTSDLSSKTCVIQFEASGEKNVISSGFFPVQKMDIDTVPGKIIFGWEIQNDVTFLAGDVQFSVRFYSTEEIGDSIRFSYNFNTTPVSLPVKDTLNTTDKSVSIKPGEVETLTDKFSDLSKSAAESAKSAHDTAQTILGTLKTVQGYADAVEGNKVATDELVAKALESEKKAEAASLTATEKVAAAAESESIATQKASSSSSSAEKAKASETASSQSEKNSKTSEINSKASETASKKSEEASKLSETNAATSASEASVSAIEAKEAAKKADQTIATKGWIWFDDNDDSGYLTMYIADSISENVTAQDDGNGNLEVILS